jgi:hypothetical protein
VIRAELGILAEQQRRRRFVNDAKDPAAAAPSSLESIREASRTAGGLVPGTPQERGRSRWAGLIAVAVVAVAGTLIARKGARTDAASAAEKLSAIDEGTPSDGNHD